MLLFSIPQVISGQPPDWASMTEAQAQLQSALHTHCSALIKRLADGDVYLGHTTWNLYTGDCAAEKKNMRDSKEESERKSVGKETTREKKIREGLIMEHTHHI